MKSPDQALRVQFVKKLLAGGEACSKCRDIEARLYSDGLMGHVDDIVVAREDDPDSPGILLAARHGIQRAPFFVIRFADGGERVFQSYLAFKRWFSDQNSAVDELAEVVEQHPDLAFI